MDEGNGPNQTEVLADGLHPLQERLLASRNFDGSVKYQVVEQVIRRLSPFRSLKASSVSNPKNDRPFQVF